MPQSCDSIHNLFVSTPLSACAYLSTTKIHREEDVEFIPRLLVLKERVYRCCPSLINTDWLVFGNAFSAGTALPLSLDPCKANILQFMTRKSRRLPGLLQIHQPDEIVHTGWQCTSSMEYSQLEASTVLYNLCNCDDFQLMTLRRVHRVLLSGWQQGMVVA